MAFLSLPKAKKTIIFAIIFAKHETHTFSIHAKIRKLLRYNQAQTYGGSLNDISLVHSPPPAPEVRSSQLRPRTLVERARMNVGWLDSSLSIMEQGIQVHQIRLM